MADPYQTFDPKDPQAAEAAHVPIEPYRSMPLAQLVKLSAEARAAGDDRKAAMIHQHYLDRQTIRYRWIEENGLRLGTAMFELACQCLGYKPSEDAGIEVFGLAHKFAEDAANLLMPPDWGREPFRPENQGNPLASE